MVGGVVYFLIADQNYSSHSAHELHSKKSTNSNEPNAINFPNSYNSVNRNNRTNETNRKYESQTPPLKIVPSNNYANQNGRLENFNNPRPPFNPLRTSTVSPPLSSSSSSPSIFVRSTTPKSFAAQTPQPKTLLPITPTVKIPFTTTAKTTAKPTNQNKSNDRDAVTVKNVQIYPNANVNSRRKLPQPAPKHTTLLLPTSDDLEDNVVERSKLLFPSKETLENFGFTSGHQNSFGIPIEEDERVLRMLNYEMLNSQPKKAQQQSNRGDDFLLLSITTDANVHQTRVSPTLPNIKKHITSTERLRAANTTTDDGNLTHLGFLIDILLLIFSAAAGTAFFSLFSLAISFRFLICDVYN